MKRCIRRGNLLAFSAGLLAGLLLPPCWITVIAVVLLIALSVYSWRCVRC